MRRRLNATSADASQRLADTYYEETEYGFVKRTSFRRPDGSERSAILPFVFRTGLPRAPCLQLRTPIDDENTRQYYYTLYDLQIEMKARLRSHVGNWPVLVTVVGWLVLLSRLARMLVLPTQVAAIAARVGQNIGLIIAAAVVLLVLIAFVSFKGYSRERT